MSPRPPRWRCGRRGAAVSPQDPWRPGLGPVAQVFPRKEQICARVRGALAARSTPPRPPGGAAAGVEHHLPPGPMAPRRGSSGASVPPKGFHPTLALAGRSAPRGRQVALWPGSETSEGSPVDASELRWHFENFPGKKFLQASPSNRGTCSVPAAAQVALWPGSETSEGSPVDAGGTLKNFRKKKFLQASPSNRGTCNVCTVLCFGPEKRLRAPEPGLEVPPELQAKRGTCNVCTVLCFGPEKRLRAPDRAPELRGAQEPRQDSSPFLPTLVEVSETPTVAIP